MFFCKFLIKNMFGFLLLILVISTGCKHEQEHYNSKDYVKDKESKVEDPGILIFEAIAQGDLEKVKAYLSQGVDINYKGQGGVTPLIAAVKGNKYNLIDYLIQEGADPNIKDDQQKSAIDYATENDDEVVLKVLHREELSPEVLGELLVDKAVFFLKPLLVQWLLEKGASPNYNLGSQRRPKTPLIALIIKGPVDVPVQVEIAKLLITHPEFELSDSWRQRLITWCRGQYKLPEIAELL